MKNIKKVFSYSLMMIIIFLLFIYFSKNISDFKQIKLVNAFSFIPLIICGLINVLCNGIVLYYIIGVFNIKLKFDEWFGLSVLTSFYNMLTPFKGGIAVKAIYLKKRHNFSYSNCLASIAGLFVINFFVASFLGIISLFIIYLKFNFLNTAVFVLFSITLLAMLLVIFFLPRFRNSNNLFINKLINVINGWDIIKKNKKILLFSFLIIFIQIFNDSLALILTYNIFDIHLSFEKALFMSAIGILSIIVQITPMGLGINETIAIFVGLSIGILPAQALSAVLVARIVSVFTIFILGPIYSVILSKKVNFISDLRANDDK